MPADPAFMAELEKFAAESQIPFDLLASIAAGETGGTFDLWAAGDDFGDGPTSFGPFQLHVPAHGHDAAYWTGVDGAVNGMNQMRDRWRREFALMGGAYEWRNTPRSFLKMAWPRMQGADPAAVTDAKVDAAVTAGRVAVEAYMAQKAAVALPVSCPVSQEFGENPNSTYYGPAGHPGRDYACVTGTPVRACRAGQVTHADWLYHGSYPGDTTRGYGLTVLVVDNLRHEWRYAHANSLLVSVGQQVGVGDVVMLSGNTGASTGPHLHLELRINGQPVDPVPYLSAPAEPSVTLPVESDGWRLRDGPSTDAAVVASGLQAGEPFSVRWLFGDGHGVTDAYLRVDGVTLPAGSGESSAEVAAAWLEISKWLSDDLAAPTSEVAMRLSLQKQEAERRAAG